MPETSVPVDRQHIPARLVQHPQFSVRISLEPAAMQKTSEIEAEVCGTPFQDRPLLTRVLVPQVVRLPLQFAGMKKNL